MYYVYTNKRTLTCVDNTFPDDLFFEQMNLQ